MKGRSDAKGPKASAPTAFPVRTRPEKRRKPVPGGSGRAVHGADGFRSASGPETRLARTHSTSIGARPTRRFGNRSLRQCAVTPKLRPAHRDRLREWPFEAGATIGPNPPELVPTPRGPCASPEDELQRGCPARFHDRRGCWSPQPSRARKYSPLVVSVIDGQAGTGLDCTCGDLVQLQREFE